jgi:hypothetical protein
LIGPANFADRFGILAHRTMGMLKCAPTTYIAPRPAFGNVTVKDNMT